MTQAPLSHPLTEILFEALELEGAERSLLLDRACGDDAELRQEIESLLATDDAAGFSRFLQQPALDPGGAFEAFGGNSDVGSPDLDAIPAQIGPFHIVRQLGFGGMGSVYLAKQEQPIERTVAVKLIHALHQAQWQERFTAECQALARLNHPHIAALYEVGTTQVEGGRALPYVAMEFIDGAPIDTWCDREKATVEQRLRLFLDVCEGVTHAHRNGILHCDLKPGNVLVSQEGRPKVIDFGIARAVDDPERGTQLLSQDVQFGSPPYISPELISRGDGQRLDTRTDVYALGLILYQLLVGALPFRESSTWLLLLQLTEKDPALPSVRFVELAGDEQTRIAADRRLDAAALLRHCRGNLDAIVRKAIDREPDRRYGSPAEMAADIERHLRDEPILARPPTAGYLISRFVRRHMQLVAAAGLLLLVLAGGLVARSLEARRANAEAERANAEAERANAEAQRANIEADRARVALADAEQIHRFLLGLFHAANPERSAGGPTTVREVLEQGRRSLSSDLADQPRLRASLLHSVGSVYTVLGEFETAAALVEEALALRTRTLDAADPAIVESRSELGIILRRMGRFDEARPLLEEVLEARLADPAADPELVAQAHSHLGLVYWRLFRQDDAESSLRASWRLRQAFENTAGLAEAANNLGALLQTQNRMLEARPLQLQALQLFEEELGPEHPRVASALNNLAIIEESLETWRDAEALFRRAVAISETSFGQLHFRPLNYRRNLVKTLKDQHRFEEALDEARQVVVASEQLGNPLALGNALHSLGRVELAAGRHGEAVLTYRRCVDVVTSHLGSGHSRAEKCRALQAQAMAFSGDVEGSLAMLRGMVEDLDESLPRSHPTSRNLDFVLGLVSHRAGEHSAAAEHFATYLEKLLDQSHPNPQLVASGQHLQGAALAAAGDLDAAAKLLEEAFEVRRGGFGVEHPKVAETAHELGRLEMKRRRFEKAREHLELAVSIRSLFAPEDADRIASEEALEECLGQMSSVRAGEAAADGP